MNYLLMLAGGKGNRMKVAACPKQYIDVHGKPLIMYSLETFQKHPLIDGIIIVCDPEWRQQLSEWLCQYRIDKFLIYADPGNTRQGSIFSGLKCMKRFADIKSNIIIHDAARPSVSSKLISECLKPLDEYDGVMPALSVKDTCYQSADGKKIDNLIQRDQLYAGQAPESFRFIPYLTIHEQLSLNEIDRVTGSTELAFLNHLKVLIIAGEETNYKITTDEDLYFFRMWIKRESV